MDELAALEDENRTEHDGSDNNYASASVVQAKEPSDNMVPNSLDQTDKECQKRKVSDQSAWVEDAE